MLKKNFFFATSETQEKGVYFLLGRIAGLCISQQNPQSLLIYSEPQHETAR
jgi:hypothetical protein